MFVCVVKHQKNGDVSTGKIRFMDMEPGNDGEIGCTAYEYGMALADALSGMLDPDTEAHVYVSSENGISFHVLKAAPGASGYVISDRDSGRPPLLRFKKRTEKIPDRYLIIVDAARNLNDCYKMTDLGGGTWGATNGRIGERQGKNRRSRNVVIPKTYPDYRFGLAILEKLLSGYQDKSECHEKRIVRKKNEEATVYGIEDDAVADLIERLMRYAQQAIAENYSVSYTDVSDEMIRQANEALDRLRKSTTLEEFNQHLNDLMCIIPRKIDGRGAAGVRSQFASEPADYAEILEREKELLDIMEGQIRIKNAGDDKREGSILDSMGISMRRATDAEFKEAKAALDGGLQEKLKAVYCVTNNATQKKFDGYIRKAGTGTRLFWHGSKNRNWISILQKGLLLNPDAEITGKMFGQGIYFAPSAMKSWGYTSSPSAKWTNESGDSVFMAMFNTAYGNPYVIYTRTVNSRFNWEDLKRVAPNCDCLHAKADKGLLHADEVIFYREDQVTVKYLCEFAA